MKIGVFGDSFSISYSPDDTGWVSVIKNRGYDITSHGCSGTSSWWSYEQFLSHFTEYTHIIFMYSHHDRISTAATELIETGSLPPVGHFPSEALLTYSETFNCLPDNKKNIMVALTTANRIANDSGRYFSMKRFIEQQIFDQVNAVCANANTKLINVGIWCDKKTTISDQNSTGSFLYNLFEVSVSEKDSPFVPGSFVPGSTSRFTDTRDCHLSKHNNAVLADIFLEILQQGCDRNINQNLFEHPGFVYD